jgi:UDP-N-acetylglucosamine--N-acetylmuramyl-(pentapeptide) pyrophosphoryl-undecaprenol N-acetylglucosamine transferase
LKSLARFADIIAVTIDQSQKFFNKGVYETGYPLRPDLALWDRQTAYHHLNISGKFPVLLVSGGSKGARSINQAVLNNLKGLLARFEIIHLCGDGRQAVVRRLNCLWN